MVGGERGKEGGGVDLNFGTPEPVLSAIRSDKPPRGLSSLIGEAKRSEKDVVMKGCVEKVKLLKELAEVSKLPPEDAIRYIEEQ